MDMFIVAEQGRDISFLYLLLAAGLELLVLKKPLGNSYIYNQTRDTRDIQEW